MSWMDMLLMPKDFKMVFRALKYRNYRLFFLGQSISLIGTWMQQVAMSWLVYRLTGSLFLLGMIGFVSQIPAFLFTAFAGVIADRHNRRKMLILTQFFSMVQALILSFLILRRTTQVWHLIVLSALLGIVNAFDIPTRQAFTIEMIEKREDLGNAIALNSSMVNAARLVGPSIAGVLIASFGEAVCFILNALSYIPVIISLFLMKIASKKMMLEKKHILQELKEGFIYAFNFVPIKSILLLVGLVSLMGVPYQVLMPFFAKEIFHGGSRTFGFLVAMSGIGALMGAMYLAARKSIVGLGRIIAITSGFFGLGIVIFSLSRILWFSMIVILGCGFAMMVQMASSNTILQTIVEEDKRGRIMSFYTMSFMGMAPFGSLLAGSLANRIGAPETLLIGGLCCIVGALIFARKLPLLKEKIRPIYARKGIIPEVAKGIRSASDLGAFSED